MNNPMSEQTAAKLGELYSSCGYARYKMNKFEQYDLYVRNKDFLVSDNIITFTDTNGKLMALKPDVTLSIIKNSGEVRGVQKLYYNENVYRVSGSTHSFKEITQVGLECIGELDEYSIFEVLKLACRSLAGICEDFVLDISHMGIIAALVDEAGLSDEAAQRVIACIGEKNAHGIRSICESEGCTSDKLCRAVAVCGGAEKAADELAQICPGEAADELVRLVRALERAGFAGRVRVDFSVINDMNYYSGVVFRGFVPNVAAGVLSGGQYDGLMRKMGRKAGAIGFAVYLDMLDRLAPERGYDVDAVLLYDVSDSIEEVERGAAQLRAEGKSVAVHRSVPGNIKYRQLFRLSGSGAEVVE